MIQKEANHELEDRQLCYAVNRRNEIENTIYSTRIKLQDEFASYAREDEKTALPPLMDEVETWLYSGDEQVYDKNILEAKSSKMMEIAGKLYARFISWRDLEEVVYQMEKYNVENVNKVNQICESTFKDFIKSDDLFNLISNSSQNLNELKTQIIKTPRVMDPPITAEVLKKQYDELHQVIFF